MAAGTYVLFGTHAPFVARFLLRAILILSKIIAFLDEASVHWHLNLFKTLLFYDFFLLFLCMGNHTKSFI